MMDDCIAETFEEAFAKNDRRLSHERDGAAELRAAMLKDGENPSGIDPEFWEGAIEANRKAWTIYQGRGARSDEETAAEIRLVPIPQDKPKVYVSGFTEIIEHWSDAIEDNHPGTIVYW